MADQQPLSLGDRNSEVDPQLMEAMLAILGLSTAQQTALERQYNVSLNHQADFVAQQERVYHSALAQQERLYHATLAQQERLYHANWAQHDQQQIALSAQYHENWAQHERQQIALSAQSQGVNDMVISAVAIVALFTTLTIYLRSRFHR